MSQTRRLHRIPAALGALALACAALFAGALPAQAAPVKAPTTATQAAPVAAGAVKRLGTTYGYNRWVSSVIIRRGSNGRVYSLTTTPGAKVEFKQGGYFGRVVATVYTANAVEKNVDIYADFAAVYANDGAWYSALN